MKRTFLAVFVLVAMLLSVVPAGAVTDEAIFEVKSLGIIKGDENGNLRLEDNITRGEFATMVIRLLGYEDLTEGRETGFSDVPATHVHAGAIALMSDLGFINGDGTGNFNPDVPIKVQDCLKILVCATGYDIAAKAKGGYPSGYVAVATELKMSRDLERTLSENATRGDVVSMIYHSLDVSLLEQGYSFDGEYVKTGETLRDRIANKEDIYSASGIVTANFDTWLVAPVSDIEEDEIEIDSIRYTSGNINTSSFIGRYVEVFYREEVSGERTILNMALSTKNSETIIEDKDFDSITANEINYRNERDRRESLTLDSDVVYVYNNRVMTQYTQEDLVLSEGRYECVDNDMDKKYEYIFIYNYESSVVDRVNTNGSIYLKTQLPIAGRNYILLDEEDDDRRFKLRDKDGNNVALADVQADDVVTVYRSLDGSFTDIVVSSKNVMGKIEEMNDDGDILIDGGLYSIGKSVNLDELKLGNNVIAYINEWNKVVFLEEGEETSFRYGYVLASGKAGLGKPQVKLLVSGNLTSATEAEETEGTDDEGEVVSILLCKNSEVICANLAEKVKLDDGRVTAAEAIENLDASCPVKFKLNGDGEVSSIEILDRDFGLDIQSPTTNTTGLYFNSEDGTFYNNNSASVVPFGVNSETKVICVPTTLVNANDIAYDAGDEELLSLIRISPQSKNILHVSGYVLDEDTKCVELMVVKSIMEPSMSAQDNVRTTSDVGIVTNTYVKIDEFGEEVKAVKLLTKNGELDLTVADTRMEFGDNAKLKDGDFVLYILDVSGKIFTTKVIKSMKETSVFGKTYPISSESTFTGTTGTVQDITRLEINAADGKRYHELVVSAGSTSSTANFRLQDKPVVFVYNKGTEAVSIGTFDDIMHGDTVCVLANQTTTGNNIKACVVVRGE